MTGTKTLLRFLAAITVSSGVTAHAEWFTPAEMLDQAYGENDGKVRIYRNEENPYIQEFNPMFRAQYQGALLSTSQDSYPGSHNSTSEWRRFRLGANAKVFKDFKLTNVWNIGGLDSRGSWKNGLWNDHGQTTGSLYEASIVYSYKKDFSIGIGKHYPALLAENKGSSADYKTPELSNLENQFSASSAFGVKIFNNEADHDFGWHLAAFSNTEERKRGTWGTWQSAFTLVGLSYKADKIILDKGRVSFDWIHNLQDMDAFASSKFRDTFTGTTARDVFALYYRGEEGPAGLLLEGIWGNKLASYKKDDRLVKPGNVVGVIIMPTYMITKNIQAVVRYQWSTGSDAVKLNPRYADVVRTNGSYVDDYQAIGAGFNFYIYHKDPTRLKIMTFAEYSNTNKRHGTGGLTGWTFYGGVYTNF